MRRDHREGDRYTTSKYFHRQSTDRSRVASQEEINRVDRDGRTTPDNYSEDAYDDLNTGKYENYGGGGYYGSNYGSTNAFNAGRDYEQNAGYRENYNRLTTGQWPEIERAQQQRSSNNHRGKGPKNYQRSDIRIREAVNDALMEDPYVDASDIEVTVENGQVVLTGLVDDKHAKRRAEDLVEDLSGIKSVENRIQVRRPGSRIVNVRNHED